MATKNTYRPRYRLPHVLLITIFALLVSVVPPAGAQGVTGAGSDIDNPPPDLAQLASIASPNHYGSSPFAPPDETDSTFVVDQSSGLDTGCTFRSGGPLVFDIQVDRYPGDIDKLLAAGRAGANAVLRMPAWDVDYNGGGSGFNPERDRVFFNGQIISPEYLTGDDQVWKLNAFNIPLNLVRFPSDPGDGGTITPEANTIQIVIDTANSGEYWCTAIDWAALSIDVPRPLLMLHGINSTGATWSMWTNNLNGIGLPSATIDLGMLDSIEDNAAEIGPRVDGLLQRWGVDSLNLLGHSHGGLDARHYVENHDTVDKVTQIGTPNAGSPLADAIQAGAVLLLGGIPTAIIDALAGPASYQITTPYMGLYNLFHGHNANVTYVSLAGDYRWGGWGTPLDLALMAFYFGAHDTVVPVWSVHALGYTQHLTYASTGSNEQAKHTSQTASTDIYNGNMPSIVAAAAIEAVSTPVTTNPVGGSVQQGQTKTHTLIVDGTGPATFLLFHGRGEIDFTLTSPSGQHINPSAMGTNPNVAFARVEAIEGLRYQAYTINHPQAGSWTLHVTGLTVPNPPGEEPYVITGLVTDSPIQLQASTDRAAYHSGEPIVIQAALQGGVTGASATVEAKVVHPDQATFDLVALTDDGTAGDPVAGDGVYTGAFAATAQPGLYQILVTAIGNTPPFGRSAFLMAPVSASTSVLSGGFTGGGIDTDGDGLFNQLAVNVGVNITAPGTFRVLGVLADPAGVEIETAVATATLAAGTHTMDLLFDGATIFQHGVDGPYTLKLVRLAEDIGSTVLPLDELADAYTSPAYGYAQFQHPAIYFPGTGADQGIDTDGNGLFDWLEVGVDVDLATAGYYYWSGHLVDKNGAELGFVSGEGSLNSGVNRLTFNFPGLAIGNNGVDGPYYLNDVLIYSGSNSAAVFRVYTTAAYDVQQFEGAPARAHIFGHVFLDANADGWRNLGETAGVGGVPVTLSQDGTVIDAITSFAPSGWYDFGSRPPGNYCVEIATPAGYVPTTATKTCFTLDTTGKAANFGLEPARASIGDLVFFDLNGNGAQDAGEPGLSNVTVALWSASGGAPVAIVATTTTGAGGAYLFADILPGEYFVQVTDTHGELNDLALTTAGNPLGPITLVHGQTYLDADFGYNLVCGSTRGAISGRVWLDTNGDAVQDAGEVGIPGVTVYAQPLAHTPTRTRITNAEGYFYLCMPRGTYLVSPETDREPLASLVPTTSEFYLPVVVRPGGGFLTAFFGYQ